MEQILRDKIKDHEKTINSFLQFCDQIEKKHKIKSVEKIQVLRKKGEIWK